MLLYEIVPCVLYGVFLGLLLIATMLSEVVPHVAFWIAMTGAAGFLVGAHLALFGALFAWTDLDPSEVDTQSDGKGNGYHRRSGFGDAGDVPDEVPSRDDETHD